MISLLSSPKPNLVVSALRARPRASNYGREASQPPPHLNITDTSYCAKRRYFAVRHPIL